jgi:hypothetical protein
MIGKYSSLGYKPTLFVLIAHCSLLIGGDSMLFMKFCMTETIKNSLREDRGVFLIVKRFLIFMKKPVKF